MKFPNLTSIHKLLAVRGLVLLAALFLTATVVSAQMEAAVNPSGDIDQCRNGDLGTDPCSGNNWVNGNAGAQNSQYAEDEYIPYRMRFDNLAPGPAGDPATHIYTLVLGYDVIHGGLHAIDYLGTYNNLKITDRTTGTASTRVVDPCSGIAGCSGWSKSTIPITTDGTAVTSQTNPNTGGFVYQPTNQVFTMWGGTLLSFDYTALNSGGGNVERQVTITFTAQVSNPVLAWSGHIAWLGDWGVGNSAGGISGSPYHMRFIGLDGQGGNQDRSLSADAVTASGAVFIRKAVITPDCSNYAPNSVFNFSASANFGSTAFTLVDNNPTPGPTPYPCPNPPASPSVPVSSQAINNFGAGNAITVSELTGPGGVPGEPTGWTLLGVNCVETGIANSTQNGLGPTATIIVEPTEVVTCTFSNSQLAPTAAPASISGRVATVGGVGIRGASLMLIDINNGEVLTAVTNSFGNYEFSDLEVDHFYVLTVSHRKYSFSPDTRSFTLMEDLVNVDFTQSE